MAKSPSLASAATLPLTSCAVARTRAVVVTSFGTVHA